jgi:hypothetical protein
MFADDGIMFSDSKESIEKVIRDYLLPNCGIIFSNKTKKNGKPASSFILESQIDFLGATLDMEKEIIYSEHGKTSIHSELNTISKII